jgi:hypothetical protein
MFQISMWFSKVKGREVRNKYRDSVKSVKSVKVGTEIAAVTEFPIILPIESCPELPRDLAWGAMSGAPEEAVVMMGMILPMRIFPSTRRVVAQPGGRIPS